MKIFDPASEEWREVKMTKKEEEVYTLYIEEKYGELSRADQALGKALFKMVNKIQERWYYQHKPY